MPSGTARRVCPQDIQLVQNLIERCLQLYMNRKEVVDTLLVQAKIEPGFTELVWQKLEEENQEFFKAYYLRLMLKHQIVEFNKLLEQQVQLMHQMHPTGVANLPERNGTHITQFQNSAFYAQELPDPAVNPETFQHPANHGLTNSFTNGRSSLHSTMLSSTDISVHANRIGNPPNMTSSQSSNMVLMQGVNGGLIKIETGYSGASPYMFDAESNVLEARSTIGDACGIFQKC